MELLIKTIHVVWRYNYAPFVKGFSQIVQNLRNVEVVSSTTLDIVFSIIEYVETG